MSPSRAAFAGLQLAMTPALWLLAAFICAGPFVAQGLVLATGGSGAMALAVAGGHFLLSVLAGAWAHARAAGGVGKVPGGALASVAMAAASYNALALVVARLLAG